jgi:hypothetical protein
MAPPPGSSICAGRGVASCWTDAEEDLGRLLGVVPVWPTANIVFVGNQPMGASMLLAGFSDDLALVLGVRMKVVLEPAGEGIITAHPLP